MYCNNCGKKGHMYRDCRLPVTSCGNIIYRDDGDEPKVLMIQRKDSLCYIDFVRGKYDNRNLNYMQTLIDKCSVDEKHRLLNISFRELWINLWLLKDDFTENDDYMRCMLKFNIIKEGLTINSILINIKTLIDTSKYKYPHSEWEFPKGRRNMNENDFDCAKREFNEETNYDRNDYDIINNLSPFTEEFLGENNVRYKYIYFIGKLCNYDKILRLDPNNNEQITEIKDIQWLTKKESLNKCRDYHTSRINLIEKIFNFIELTKGDMYSLIS
jgi:8-oxo-dGTP pyrophosphatase MutT (NUDIX family)